MASAILGIIGSLCLMAIGLWKYCGRKNAYKRELGKEAKEKLDDALKNKEKSGFLDAFMRVTRARRMR